MTRNMIIVLTLITALVHLVLLNMAGIQPMFVLNGLGYLGLLAAYLYKIPAGRERMVHFAFITYTAVTIIAWIALGSRGILGYATKAVEVALIYFLWQSLQALPASKK